MKNTKKVVALITVLCMIVGLFSGCTSAAEGKALYDAMVKTQDITSCQSDMEFALRLDATGLSGQDKVKFDQMKAMVSGAKLSMNMKQASSVDMTESKAEAKANVLFGGMSMDMGVWVDMDLNASSPKLKEVIKLPTILTAMDPSMAGKEYMVMDLMEMSKSLDSEGKTLSIDYAETMKLTKELQTKATTFMSNYLAQYDPGFKFITDVGTKDIVTPERTVKAHVYQVKLDDQTAKKLVRYTVNNLADNKDAIEFMAEYMKLIGKFAVPTPGVESPTEEFEKIMADYEKGKPALLAEFNRIMDQVAAVKLVGDKGIVLEYAIDENGYIVSQSGSMDFVIDVAKLDSIGNKKEDKAVSTEIYNVGFDYSMLSYNLNKDMAISMPVVTAENSINFTDMLKTPEPAKPEEPVIPELVVNKKTTKVLNNITYLPARDTVKLINGATYVYSNGAATIKVADKTFVVAPGKTSIKVNGMDVKLNAVDGKIVNGRFYVTVEVMEQLGFKVVLK